MTGGILTVADATETGSGENVLSDLTSCCSDEETSGGVSAAGLLSDVMEDRLNTMLPRPTEGILKLAARERLELVLGLRLKLLLFKYLGGTWWLPLSKRERLDCKGWSN